MNPLPVLEREGECLNIRCHLDDISVWFHYGHVISQCAAICVVCYMVCDVALYHTLLYGNVSPLIPCYNGNKLTEAAMR